MMSDPLGTVVYADIIPETIQVTESYHYLLQVRANYDTILDGEPQGVIRLEVPYDGGKHFSKEVAEEIAEYASLDLHPSAQAQIGWVAMGAPRGLENRWELPTTAEIMPVRIPLKGGGIFRESQWTRDDLRAVLRHTYTPIAPRYWPLQMEFKVYDDQTVPQDNLEDYYKLIAAGSVGPGEIIFELAVTVYLPDLLQQDQVKAWLEDLEIEWPTIAPKWQLDIFQEPKGDPTLQKREWHYNPANRQVELHHLTMELGDRKPGSPLVPYVCKLRLHLRVPGKVVMTNNHTLRGKLRLCLDGVLLSGRQAAWLDAAGVRLEASKAKIGHRSDLVGQFTILLVDQFQVRRTTTKRLWHFSGVAWSYYRQDDIGAILRDLGYTISFDREKKWVEGKRITIVSGKYPTPLSISITAIPSATGKTQRERTIPDGLTITTETETSDLILYVVGRGQAGVSELARDLETIMVKLNQQFKVVADLR
ncbi:MAG: hypothetical protein MUC85_06925 [Anaerolineales bacterium]|jgi:hypothetical protein|nr:hypothetical protein [Anaerolineales bacterium]